MKDYSGISDEQIVDLVRKQDKQIYSEIIARYQSKLMRYAHYLVSDEHLGADIVQEAFIKAYINLRSFNTKKKFSGWIYRIVHNEAINQIRKNKKYSPLITEVEYDSGISLEDELIKKELIRKTHQCLDNMPLIYKEPLSLYFLEDKSYEDISDILRLPVSTVGTRISRAKSIMKALCQKNSQ